MLPKVHLFPNVQIILGQIIRNFEKPLLLVKLKSTYSKICLLAWPSMAQVFSFWDSLEGMFQSCCHPASGM